MKPIAAVLFAASALLPFAAQAQQPQSQSQPRPTNVTNANDPAVKAATGAATEAARRWLALLDAERAGDCWAALAPAAQNDIDQESFAGVLAAVREQYGAVKTRRPHTVTFTHQMPDVPPGDYVVSTYDSEFAKGAHATETVILMRTPDGSWKVSAYFVQ